MTDPKEKGKAPIKTRTPGRIAPSGMFDHVKLRPAQTLHPIEEILSGSSHTQTPEQPATPVATPVDTPVETPVTTGAATPVATPVEHVEAPHSTPKARDDERQPYLDSTHTASEKSIYSVMYRETISRSQRERHFGFKELSTKTGIRSDATVRRALDGLLAKLSVEIVSYIHGNPLGPRYRVYEPREILRRRRDAGIEIDQQSKRIVTPVATGVITPVATGVTTSVATGANSYGGTPAISTPVTPAESTGVINNRNISSNPSAQHDDEAFASFVALLRQKTKEVTGREPSPADSARWTELGELLTAELTIAAERTSVVSSAPALLVEHLRRRLLVKPPARQSVKPPPPVAHTPTTPAPVQSDEDLVDTLVTFLHGGMTIDDLDGHLSKSVETERWPQIRAAVVERYERERKHVAAPKRDKD